MKTCSKCLQVKCPWYFSFSIKHSKYYDICRECVRKKRPLCEGEKLRKKEITFADPHHAYGRIKPKGE